MVMALTLMIMIAWYARRRGFRRDTEFSVPNLWFALKKAFLPLLTPVILVGGMVTGVFTPTEAAIAATVYVGHPVATVLLSQNFDSVAAPALPAGWTSALLSGTNHTGYSGVLNLGSITRAGTPPPRSSCAARAICITN